MKTDRELMQQALEALEAALSDDQPYFVKCGLAIIALRKALEQPEQEPVAWMSPKSLHLCGAVDESGQVLHIVMKSRKAGDWSIPIYTRPQPAAPSPKEKT